MLLCRGQALGKDRAGIEYEFLGAIGAGDESLAILGELDALPEILSALRPDELILSEADVDERQLLEIVEAAHRCAVKVRLAPKTTELLVQRGEYVPGQGVPLFELRPPVLAGADWALKRTFDLVVSLVVLVAGLPFLVLIAAAIKLDSPGPVFYTQTRVGVDRRWNRTTALRERRVEDLGGQPFTILKFRSMRTDAEANGQAVWASKHDARVTPVGRVLRKTRLDEIPQLINVLRGEMNIVGPRPERPSIVVRLRDDIPEYPQRHRVKPGITGWAQINYPYGASIEDAREKLEYDLYYAKNYTPFLDILILLQTARVILWPEGAR